jgi:hypothetical protein
VIRAIYILAVLLLTALSGCNSDGDDYGITVSETTPTQSSQSPEPRTGRVRVTDLRIGECFNGLPVRPSGAPNDIVGDVRVVPCTGNWEYRDLNAYRTSLSGQLPSQEAFGQEAASRCPLNYDFLLAPSRLTWDAGDRAVVCLDKR